jgi:hypothetical protein
VRARPSVRPLGGQLLVLLFKRPFLSRVLFAARGLFFILIFLSHTLPSVQLDKQLSRAQKGIAAAYLIADFFSLVATGKRKNLRSLRIINQSLDNLLRWIYVLLRERPNAASQIFCAAWIITLSALACKQHGKCWLGSILPDEPALLLLRHLIKIERRSQVINPKSGR